MRPGPLRQSLRRPIRQHKIEIPPDAVAVYAIHGPDPLQNIAFDRRHVGPAGQDSLVAKLLKRMIQIGHAGLRSTSVNNGVRLWPLPRIPPRPFNTLSELPERIEKRAIAVMQPAGAGHNSQRNIRFELVTTPQQWLHASAIRSICFLEEHNVKAELVFDGNDYMATHVVVYDGDEPIGTARIRWFKDFAKIERTSFRKAYRGISILRAFAAFGFEHIARKGYTRVITHAGEKYARLWKTVLGFQSSSKEPAYFEGQEPFYEIWKDIEPAANAVSLESSCAVLFRTEGFWDEPGNSER